VLLRMGGGGCVLLVASQEMSKHAATVECQLRILRLMDSNFTTTF